MFFGDADDRTVEPSQHRLEQARNEGRVARSVRLTSAFVACGVSLALWVIGPRIWTAAGELLKRSLSAPIATTVPGTHAFSAESIRNEVNALATGVACVLFVSVLAAVAANIVQFGVRVTPAAVSPRWSRVNPALGWSRLLSGTHARTALYFLSILVVASIAWSSVVAWEAERAAFTPLTAGQRAAQIGTDAAPF